MRALVVAVVLLVAGCGGGEEAATTTTRVTGVAGVDPVKRAAFLAGVSAVKKLGGTDDRIVRAGVNTCSDMAGGKARPAVVANAVTRFGTDTVPVTPTEADELVTVTERTLC